MPPRKRTTEPEKPGPLTADVEDRARGNTVEDPTQDALSGSVRPSRAEKVSQGGPGRLVGAEVTEHAHGEKIGRVPGLKPKVSATCEFRHAVVVLPAGPDAEVNPGPDTAAITAALAHGLRPVAEAHVDGVERHVDGVSAVVTWVVPCVEAGTPEADDPEGLTS